MVVFHVPLVLTDHINSKLGRALVINIMLKMVSQCVNKIMYVIIRVELAIH